MEDFSELDQITRRFEGWKLKYPQAYNAAYIGTSFRKIVRPLVSLEVCIAWAEH